MAKIGSGVIYVGENDKEHAAIVVGNKENGNQDLAVWLDGGFNGRDDVPQNEQDHVGHTWHHA
jgi:hypothetical protein